MVAVGKKERVDIHIIISTQTHGHLARTEGRGEYLGVGMHDYLRSIGFSKYKKKKDIDHLNRSFFH